MPRKTSSIKNASFTGVDNKPLTGLGLLKTLHTLYKEDPAALDKPITMSSDEEGNDMLSLWSIDIDKTGNITLWPAHI